MRTPLSYALTGRLLAALFLALTLAGCGGGDAPAASSGGPPVLAAGGREVRGALDTVFVLTSYQDAVCPYREGDLAGVRWNLNDLLVRNSTGAAWLVSQVASVTLPRPSADYLPGSPQGGLDLLRAECLASGPRARFTVYLLPPHPVFFLGTNEPGREGAWLSAVDWTPDPLVLPIPHEFGHLLGFPHRDPGIMSGTDQGSQADYAGWYDDEALRSVGWLTRGSLP